MLVALLTMHPAACTTRKASRGPGFSQPHDIWQHADMYQEV